jgi:putative DNA primase/helicase
LTYQYSRELNIFLFRTTEGFFSRWVVIPFTAFFPAGKADPALVHTLTSYRELQGLLRGAVGGLQQVMRRGSFTLPPSVANATDRFKIEADPLRGFIEERLESRQESNAPFVPRSEVYMAYQTWCGSNGFHSQSTGRFYEALMAAMVDTFEHPVRTALLHGIQGFRGVVLQ